MLNACTIIARNYFAYAQVLADSFFRHHPIGSFTILIIDDEDRQFSAADDRPTWWRLADIGLEPREIHRLPALYHVPQPATAVKPVLLRRLLESERDHIVYLDPDIRIFGTLDDLVPLAH